MRDSHQEEPFAGMVHRYEPSGPGNPGLDDVDQRRLEDEVRRLMTLPSERLEQEFQQELYYMPPQSKAAARPHEALQRLELDSDGDSEAGDFSTDFSLGIRSRNWV